MFKILIADDEGFVRRGIITNVPWENLGITQIFEAEDGEMALKIAKKEKPNIILSDIRMPKLDGIHLAYNIKNIINCKIIFMSAYSDKEYFKNAIKLNAIDFIEKPILLSEMISAIGNAVNLIHTELYEEKTLTPEEELNRLLFLENSKLNFSDVKYFNYFTFYNLFVVEAKNLNVLNDILSAMKELSNLFRSNLTIISHNKKIIGLFYTNLNSLSEFSNELLNFFDCAFAKIRHENFFISCSKTMNALNDIKNAFVQAESGIELLFWEGYRKLVFFSQDSKLETVLNEDEYLSDFKKILTSLDTKRIEDKLKDLTTTLFFLKPHNIMQVRFIMYKIYILINTQAKDLEISLGYDENKVFSTINSLMTFEDIVKFIFNKLDLFLKNLSIIPHEIILTSKINMVIQEYYSNTELTISFICDYVFASKSSVCNIYRKETGKTVNEAILDFRLKQACKLLRNKNYSLAYIANSTGFSDHNYFTKSFKKAMGVTPSAYRNELIL